MLRVPAWKSVVWPHDYDLMSNSVGSWISCRQRGEALGLGMDTGYGRRRHWSSPSVEDSGDDGVVLLAIARLSCLVCRVSWRQR